MIAYFIGGSLDLTKRQLPDREPERIYEVPCYEPIDLMRPPRDGEICRIYNERYRLLRLSDPSTGEDVAIYIYDDTRSGHPRR